MNIFRRKNYVYFVSFLHVTKAGMIQVGTNFNIETTQPIKSEADLELAKEAYCTSPLVGCAGKCFEEVK